MPATPARLRMKEDFVRGAVATAGMPGEVASPSRTRSVWRNSWKLLTPVDLRLDDMHIISEGIAHLLLDGLTPSSLIFYDADMFSSLANARCAGLRLAATRDGEACILAACRETVFPTYSAATLLPLNRHRTTTGDNVEQVRPSRILILFADGFCCFPRHRLLLSSRRSSGLSDIVCFWNVVPSTCSRRAASGIETSNFTRTTRNGPSLEGRAGASILCLQVPCEFLLLL